METKRSSDYTPRALEVLALAGSLARQRGQRQVGAEHLALALIAEERGPVAQVLRKMGVGLQAFTDGLDAVIVSEKP